MEAEPYVTLTGRLRCGLLLNRRAQASSTATISPAIVIAQANKATPDRPPGDEPDGKDTAEKPKEWCFRRLAASDRRTEADA